MPIQSVVATLLTKRPSARQACGVPGSIYLDKERFVPAPWRNPLCLSRIGWTPHVLELRVALLSTAGRAHVMNTVVAHWRELSCRRWLRVSQAFSVSAASPLRIDFTPKLVSCQAADSASAWLSNEP